MHADRTNRVVLLLLAVLMIAVGGAAGAASIGVYAADVEHSTLNENPVWTFFGAQSDWIWPVIAAAAAIVVLVALRWLLILLFSTDRLGYLPVNPTSSSERTVLAAGALTEATVTEIESYQAVQSASARLVGDPANPKLVVAVDLDADADVAALRRRIESGALTHARAAVGDRAFPAQLDLTVTTRHSARVT